MTIAATASSAASRSAGSIPQLSSCKVSFVRLAERRVHKMDRQIDNTCSLFSGVRARDGYVPGIFSRLRVIRDGIPQRVGAAPSHTDTTAMRVLFCTR